MVDQVLEIALKLLEVIVTNLADPRLKPPRGITMQDSAFDSMVHESGDQPELLFQKGLEAAKYQNYPLAHRLFEEGLRLAKTRSLDVTRFSFHVMWSGVICAYSIRGEPSRRVLDECRKMIKEYIHLVADDGGSKAGVVYAYLAYMQGLTHGMSTPASGEPYPVESELILESQKYEEAFKRFSSYSADRTLAEQSKWLTKCRDSVAQRKVRVEQMRKTYGPKV